MDAQDQWLKWVVELQGLAQAGLTYGRDPFDLERYARIREISCEMVSLRTGLPQEKAEALFCGEAGYQTPKLDTRAAIFQGDKILLVRETSGKWSLPGGWVDVNLSVGESAVKEVLEEAGLDVIADRIIAVQDRAKHNQPAYAWNICKVFIQCSVIGGQFQPNLETTESRYFGVDELPALATEKTTEAQVRMCFDAYHARHWVAQFD